MLKIKKKNCCIGKTAARQKKKIKTNVTDVTIIYLMSRGRNVLITLHEEKDVQYTEEEASSRFRELFGRRSVRYAIGQLEKCPNTGRLHWQVYAELTKPCRISAVKGIFGRRAHIEFRKGSKHQAVEYCTKEDTRVLGPYSFGETAKPGKRTDIESLHESLKSGKSIKEVSDSSFELFMRYRSSIQAYVLMHQTPRNWKMENYIFWGQTGTGKTHKVYEIAREREMTVYPLSQNANGTVWFDGYAGEDIVLIDDFYGWIKVSYLLKLLDKYPMMVQVKGSSLPFVSKVIIFTSNKDPENWYDWTKIGEEVQNAFFRRITKIEYFHEPYIEVREVDPSHNLEE